MASYNQNIDLTNSDLPVRLTSLREERALTKADLAEKAGLSYRTVHDLENGRRDRIQEKTLMLLSVALDVSIDDLLGRDPCLENGPAITEQTTNRRRPLLSRRTGLVILAALPVVLAIAWWGLWSSARNNAQWTRNEDKSLTVRDGIFGINLWEIANANHIGGCRVSPWRNDRLLVHVGGQTASGGCLLNLDRATGDTIWTVRPDIDAVVRAFGAEDVLIANFTCREVIPADLDGDGNAEIVALFCHGLYYPYLVCAIEETGALLNQYAHKGHLYVNVVTDLDGDGKDEFIGAGTNNAKAYQGASVIILDDEHWNGASIDSLCDPESSEPDSALYRVVIPQYPAPYMKLLQADRLSVMTLKVHCDPQGEALINMEVGRPEGCNMVVYLDGRLRPKGCEPRDYFREKWISQWPDSLIVDTGPGDPVWRAEWLARHRRFEAGHWPPPGR